MKYQYVHPGIGNKKNLKEEISRLPSLIKIMRGETGSEGIEKMKKNNMAEKFLERHIIFQLGFLGCKVAKAGEQSVYNSRYILPGMADLLVFIPSHGIVFMEVKTEKSRNTPSRGLRDSQMAFKELCLACGLKHTVAYSVNDAVQFIQKIKNTVSDPSQSR